MTDEEQLSLMVSESLNVLGFSKNMVNARRKCYDTMTKLHTHLIQKQDSDRYCTITGSKREGLAGIFESDTDLMITDTSVQCTHNPAAVTRDVKVSYIFQLDREHVPHGYAKLRLAYRNDKKVWGMIENSLVVCRNGELHLSSASLISEGDKQRSAVKDAMSECKPRAGPSLPSQYQHSLSPNMAQDTDRVLSFPCQCPEYLKDWLDRPREYDWPSKDQIDAISQLDAHVVPVGAKGSENDSMQWRICFTPAEVMLMQSLNETQWKLYKLLKMIKDDHLKPLGDLVTSYVMKNVVMWISEMNPMEQFQPTNLVQKLRQCLEFLVLHLSDGHMPSYMIRYRNMFQGILNHDNRKEYLIVLNPLLQDGQAMVTLCPKLKETMTQLKAFPSVAREEMEKRDHMELPGMQLTELPFKDLAKFIKILQCPDRDEAIKVGTSFVENNAERMASLWGCSVEGLTQAAITSELRKVISGEGGFLDRIYRS